MSGLSLIELMVSMAIGMVVIGIGAASFVSIAANSRSVNALSQMSNDASIALGILRNHVALAGYSHLTGADAATGKMNRAFNGGKLGDRNNFIVGCDGSFADPRANELNISQLACAGADATAPDAIAVVYEADIDNTYPASDNTATDCLGNSVPAHVYLTPPTLKLASNKFYVDTNAQGITGLYCQGNGRSDAPVADVDTLPSSGTGVAQNQMLVENITDLQITYGLADPETGGNQAIAYLSASDVRSLSGAQKWAAVVSARICVEVRSAATNLASEQKKYLNCAGDVVDNTSGRLVRTFSTTVVLHNHISKGI